MAKVGAQRAAELTGKSKSTVQRAMKSGKISFEKDHNGRRVIDVAELERAFGLVPQGNSSSDSSVESELKKAADLLEIERLKMRTKMLEEQLDNTKEQLNDMKLQRDQWQKQAQQVLLTSEYSQKQAEELKAEIKERQQKARIRRQQEMERRMKNAQRANSARVATVPDTTSKAGNSAALKVQGLWHKLRGQNQNQVKKTEAGSKATQAGNKKATA
jgi:vacuolar-type H+-ATPase subunit I/STV1